MHRYNFNSAKNSVRCGAGEVSDLSMKKSMRGRGNKQELSPPSTSGWGVWLMAAALRAAHLSESKAALIHASQGLEGAVLKARENVLIAKGVHHTLFAELQ